MQGKLIRSRRRNFVQVDLPLVATTDRDCPHCRQHDYSHARLAYNLLYCSLCRVVYLDPHPSPYFRTDPHHD